MTFEWLLFDADGTLFDYDTAEGRALAATFADLSLPFDAQAAVLYREINGRLWRDFEQGLIDQQTIRGARFTSLLDALGLAGDGEAMGEQYLHNLSHATDLIDGALETVQTLHTRYQLALITNGIPQVQHGRLALSPLGAYFPNPTISGEVGYAKPDPRIFDAAFAAMGHPARDVVLIIGDSQSADIGGGAAYGIATCWFNPQRIPADPQQPATFEIASLAELPPLLEGLV